MYLLCLSHVEVWAIVHRSPELQIQDTQSARLNMELTWESPRGSLRRMPGHGLCRGAVKVAVVPWPLSRWPVGSLFTRTEDWRGRGRESSDWAQRFSAKRKTCLVVLPKQLQHNTPVQVAAEGKRVCLLGLCVGTPFKPFIPTILLCVNKLCKKSVSSGVKRRQSLWQVRQPALCWHVVLSTAAFLVFTPERALFSYSPFM